LEQTVVNVNRPVEASDKPLASDGLSSVWAQPNLVTEDPATFLIAHHIVVTGTKSVAAIRKYFSRAPEILEVVDVVLSEMERAEVISVDGDTITAKERFVDLGGNIENLRRFVPQLFQIAADRVLEDAAAGLHRPKRDGIRYWAIPNDKRSSIEAQAIYSEFKAKMNALVDRIKTEDRNGESVRLVGTFNCSLSPEDFA
jgi:hypothetical protein